MKKLFSIVLLALTPSALSAADWRQFRGPNGNGIAAETAAPTKLTEQSVAWKIPLPGRGLSSAIIVGERVFVTASSGTEQDRLHVLCFSAKDGAKLWERQFWATGRTMTHPKTAVAAPTPCSDGRQIFCIFSSNDVVCLDLEGNLLWLRGLGRDYPNASNSLGMASSPVVVGDTLICQVENDSESFAVGLDAGTGANRWKLDRPKMANWTSPLLVPRAGVSPLVILQSGKGLSALEPRTGKEVWYYTEGAATIPSSTFAEGVFYAASKGITALRPSASSPHPEQLWQAAQLSPATASPIVIGGKIFTLNNAGILSAGDVKDGTRLWQLRLTGPFSSSPIAVGAHLYLANEKGLLQVVNTAAPEGEIASTMDLKETALATPSIAAGALYIRTEKTLWKIGAR
jgi:outer membrane protein assembly factor BamB